MKCHFIRESYSIRLITVFSHQGPYPHLQRKYNHMELVCEEFSKLSGYEYNFDLIKRIKDTKPQYKLNREQRLENLSSAFKVNKDFYKNKTVLIIDDICTTGSTFEEMIKELNNSGITDIVCFATSTP